MTMKQVFNVRRHRALCRLIVVWMFSLFLISVHHASAFMNRGSIVRNALYGTVQFSKLPLSRSPEEEERSLENDKVKVGGPHRIRQKRRRPAQKRPARYWSDLNNLRSELRAFWIDRGVKLTQNKLPPIPNEVVLRYYQRNDLRAAIVKYGGRDAVSQILGRCPIVPGRWKDAVHESPELRALVEADAALSLTSPPSLTKSSRNNETARWQHQDGRNPKGYWNKQTLLKEMYVHLYRYYLFLLVLTVSCCFSFSLFRYGYVAVYREKYQRPAVWMPRPSEFAKEGRDDIRQSITRFGGAAQIGRLAGMVPFREWYYFEGQLELLMELQRFLKEHGNGDDSFPVVKDVKRHGFDQLHSLIQYYGGRKFLAARLGMSDDKKSDLCFGSFSLDFAVRLLSYIRQRELRKKPPLANPSIMIPSSSHLLGLDNEEARYLHESIIQFGGYENVARRLGLAFSSGSGR